MNMCSSAEANLRRSVETSKEERAQGGFMNSCHSSPHISVLERRPEQRQDRAQETRTILTRRAALLYTPEANIYLLRGLGRIKAVQ